MLAQSASWYVVHHGHQAQGATYTSYVAPATTTTTTYYTVSSSDPAPAPPAPVQTVYVVKSSANAQTIQLKCDSGEPLHAAAQLYPIPAAALSTACTPMSMLPRYHSCTGVLTKLACVPPQ